MHAGLSCQSKWQRGSMRPPLGHIESYQQSLCPRSRVGQAPCRLHACTAASNTAVPSLPQAACLDSPPELLALYHAFKDRSAPRAAPLQYLGPISVQDVGVGRGRGVIITRDVTAGELLLVCTADAVVYPCELEGHSQQRTSLQAPARQTGAAVNDVVSAASSSPVAHVSQPLQPGQVQDGSRPGLSGALTRTLAARMQHDGLLWRRVMSMHAGAAYSGAHEPQELGLQGAPIPVDVVRVQSVVDLNAYGGMQLQDVFNLVARPVAPVLTVIGDQSQPSTTAPGMSEKNTISQQAPDFVLPPTTNEQPAASTSATYSSRQTLPLPPTGLWVIPGMINHSCLPNVTRTFVGDVIFVRAACGLPAGTEAVWSYVPPSPHLYDRRALLQAHYGFACSCTLCTAQAGVGSARRARLEAALTRHEDQTVPMAAQLIRRRPTLRATGTHSPARSDSSEEQQQVLAFFLEGSEVLALVNADIAALQSVLQQKPSAQHGQPGIAESQDASIILQVPASDPWVTAAWALSMALALAGPMQLKVSLYSVLANAAGSIPIVSASQMRTILDSIVMFAEADIIRYALPLSHSKHDNVLAARATSALIVPMDGQSVQASDGLDVHACQQLLWTAAAACASGHASHLLLPAACNHTPTSMEPKPAAAAPQQLPHPEQSSHGVKTSQVMQTGAPEMSAAAAPFSACGADAICAHIVAAVLYTRAGQSRAARASVSAARCLWQVEVGSQTLFDEVFGWLVGGSDT